MKIKNRVRPLLLVADLDGTLFERNQLAKDAAERFTRHWICYHMFNGSKLVYNTGRSLEDVLVIWAEGFDLPHADVVATCVGSSVYNMNY